MDASVAYVGKVLQAYFDPSKPPEVKAELEAGLSQFKGRDDGWRLAMHVLQGESRGDAHDPYLLWFSATLLQEAINKSWPAIPEEVDECKPIAPGHAIRFELTNPAFASTAGKSHCSRCLARSTRPS